MAKINAAGVPSDVTAPEGATVQSADGVVRELRVPDDGGRYLTDDEAREVDERGDAPVIEDRGAQDERGQDAQVKLGEPTVTMQDDSKTKATPAKKTAAAKDTSNKE